MWWLWHAALAFVAEILPQAICPACRGADAFQGSALRMKGEGFGAPVVMTNSDFRFIVAEQLQEIGIDPSAIVIEPEGRNTAPAISLAALAAQEVDPEALLLVLPSDHVITKLAALHSGIRAATELATGGHLVTFGIEAAAPETGYGYIERAEAIQSGYHVARFVEKPDLEQAQTYVDSGQYYWNSGMFMLDTEAYLEALHKFEPAIFEACQMAYQNASSDLDFKRVDSAAFSDSPSVSIDYAVMERLENLHVLPYQGDWSDVGAWDSVASLADQNAEGNAVQGDGVLLDSQNTFIRAESRLVTGIGLENLVVIETRDAVLIADATKTQNVKELVDLLKSNDRKEATEHQRMYRPWGSYETLVMGDRFQVKQIVVNPGASLSLQMHHHRAEHWVVVSGTAEVQVDDGIQMLTEDQSVYIPIGSKHRLTNPGKLPLTLIEVQSGGYLGEDDIVRFDDAYGR